MYPETVWCAPVLLLLLLHVVCSVEYPSTFPTHTVSPCGLEYLEFSGALTAERLSVDSPTLMVMGAWQLYDLQAVVSSARKCLDYVPILQADPSSMCVSPYTASTGPAFTPCSMHFDTCGFPMYLVAFRPLVQVPGGADSYHIEIGPSTC